MIPLEEMADGGIYTMNISHLSPAVWDERHRHFDAVEVTFGYGYAVPIKRLGTLLPERRNFQGVREIVNLIRQMRGLSL